MTLVKTPLAIAAAVLVALASAAPAAFGAGAIEPGAYCPFPEEGETPKCLEPAQDEYGEFFRALASGDLSDEVFARLERDVASGASSKAPYLAISSLSYGYYRLAKRAATNPDEDPAVIARLQRWNELLALAYDTSADDLSYRAAVRAAALDLEQRGPQVELPCADELGRTTACNSTEAVLRGFNRAEETVGIRGALGRLIQRMTRRSDR